VPASSLHSMVLPASSEEKVKLAELLLSVPEGPESMVVSGGVVSAGGGPEPAANLTLCRR
jgi:hypothetical protein